MHHALGVRERLVAAKSKVYLVHVKSVHHGF